MSIKMRRTLYLGMSALMLAPLAESTMNPIMANAKRRHATYHRSYHKPATHHASYNRKRNYGGGVKMSPNSLRRAGGYSRVSHHYSKPAVHHYSKPARKSTKKAYEPNTLAAYRAYSRHVAKKHPAVKKTIKRNSRKATRKMSARKPKKANNDNSATIPPKGYNPTPTMTWGDGTTEQIHEGGGNVSIGNGQTVPGDEAESAYADNISPSTRSTVLSLEANPVNSPNAENSTVGSATSMGISFANTSSGSSADSALLSDTNSNSVSDSKAESADGMAMVTDTGQQFDNIQDNQQALDTINGLNLTSGQKNKLESAYANDPQDLTSTYWNDVTHNKKGSETDGLGFDRTNSASASSLLDEMLGSGSDASDDDNDDTADTDDDADAADAANGESDEDASDNVSNISDEANSVASAQSDTTDFAFAPTSSAASSMNTQFSKASQNVVATTNPDQINSAAQTSARTSAASGMLKVTSKLASKAGNSKVAKAANVKTAHVVSEGKVNKSEQATPFEINPDANLAVSPSSTKLALNTHQLTDMAKKPGFESTFMPIKQAKLSNGKTMTEVISYNGKYEGWVPSNNIAVSNNGKSIAVPKGTYHFADPSSNKTYALPVDSSVDNPYIEQNVSKEGKDALHVTAARKITNKNGKATTTYYVKDDANPSVNGWVSSDELSTKVASSAKNKAQSNRKPVKSGKNFTTLNLNVIGTADKAGNNINGNGTAGDDKVALPKNFNSNEVKVLKGDKGKAIDWNAMTKAFFSNNDNMSTLKGSTEYYEQNGHDIAVPKNQVASAIQSGKKLFHFNYTINLSATKNANKNAKNGDVVKVFYNRNKVNDASAWKKSGKNTVVPNKKAASQTAKKASKAASHTSKAAKATNNKSVTNKGTQKQGTVNVPKK